MDAIEAMIYCIHFVDENPTDGEFHSQTAFDKFGDPHWVAWSVKDGEDAIPRLCSGSPTPFAKSLEPYRT